MDAYTGDEIFTLTDEEGNNFKLEIVGEVEYENDLYRVFLPTDMDEDDPDSGTVTIDIELANSGAENGININELYSGGDKNYALRWQMILKSSGIDEELEVEAPEADGDGTKRHNLMNLLLASWNDWRDDDDNVSKGPLSDNEPEEDDGAESAWYEESDEAAEKEAHGKADGVIVRMSCYTADFHGELHPDNEIEELAWFTTADMERISAVDKLIFTALHDKGLLN